ncbi:hypothetical protein TVAG_493740 [Trichomonas vaginalis G3]|uniref:Surface antigen BspA-like n=1 Tax=Trichomonas vaginalis (strain ATCC PRA-98 / G3) TaxID=412133 RepID=A2DQ05_TRIV3|nr:ribonuclease inhibitor domain-containing protein [Trichomonas vaginalis G3]EAY17432.1 hypothetical protein TVAG_493740 [Trichomonas vaginalis G3]KAI5533527.1 ribonuclease inhibitor domain-containing protein [Trichomonas vaginalis G3]|eukprot:XP_001329567.1 hypothetical protein [Trichomonas vaginalis G3]
MNFQWDESTKTLTVISNDDKIEGVQTEHKTDAIHIVIQGQVKILGDQIFTSYSNVETIELPDSIEEFGNNIITFSKIKEIHIPLNLKIYHSNGPLEYNFKLEKYTIDENQQNFRVVDGVLYSKDMTKLVNIPPNYQSKIFTIPFGVTSIILSSVDYLQNIEQLIVPQTVNYIYGMLFRPKVIKKLIIYRNESMNDQITWVNTYDFNFRDSPIQQKDIIYTNSSLYATYYKENKTVVISSTDENNRYEYQDEILSLDTSITTIIYPKSVSKISSSSFKTLSHNQFTVEDFTNYTTISIYNFKYTFLCHQYFSLPSLLISSLFLMLL